VAKAVVAGGGSLLFFLNSGIPGRRRIISAMPPHHLPALISSYLAGIIRFLLSKLNTITCLRIISKWSVAMMEIFLSLDKYPALCKLKLLGAS
jgi:hypothetical protein